LWVVLRLATRSCRKGEKTWTEESQRGNKVRQKIWVNEKSLFGFPIRLRQTQKRPKNYSSRKRKKREATPNTGTDEKTARRKNEKGKKRSHWRGRAAGTGRKRYNAIAQTTAAVTQTEEKKKRRG